MITFFFPFASINVKKKSMHIEILALQILGYTLWLGYFISIRSFKNIGFLDQILWYFKFNSY